MKRKYQLFGFTLVEVIVVMAIIGILATVISVNFNGVRDEARNKAFASEMKEVQLAIELYKAQNGQYPPINPACILVGFNPLFDTAITSQCAGALVIDGLTPAFMANLPERGDSANSDCELMYIVDSVAGSWYRFVAVNCHSAASLAEGVQFGSSLARCSSTCISSGQCVPTAEDYYTSYAIYSDGGKCE